MALNPGGPQAPYLQIAAAMREQIRSGALAPGAKLPSTRELVDEFNVAPMTAQKAVAALRDEGLVYSVQGRGSFVCTDLPAPERSDNEAILQRLDEMASEIRRLDARLSRVETDQD